MIASTSRKLFRPRWGMNGYSWYLRERAPGGASAQA
jgi:hypothetical protein